MDKIFSVTILGSLLSLVSGCSFPEGGFVDIGIQGRVHYSGIVAVGTVTGITEDPSYWGSEDWADTYGATVAIWCSYKGGVLPREITIGEAGTIPGMCFANELELNEEYILFLHERTEEGYYVQADSALPVTNLSQLANVCDLELNHPAGPGVGFSVCPSPTNSPNCLKYEEPSWEIDWKDWESEELGDFEDDK